VKVEDNPAVTRSSIVFRFFLAKFIRMAFALLRSSVKDFSTKT